MKLIGTGGIFAQDISALRNMETLLNLKEFGSFDDDKVILEATTTVLQDIENTLKIRLLNNEIKISLERTRL